MKKNKKIRKYNITIPKTLYIIFNEENSFYHIVQNKNLDLPYKIASKVFSYISFQIDNISTINIPKEQKLYFDNIYTHSIVRTQNDQIYTEIESDNSYNNSLLNDITWMCYEGIEISLNVVTNLLKNILFIKDIKTCNDMILALSVETNNSKICELMLKNNANPNYRSHILGNQTKSCLDDIDISKEQCNFGVSVLHRSVNLNSAEILYLLLKYGADVNIKGEYKLSVGHWAISLGQSGILEVLLKNGMDVNSKSCHNDSLLNFCFTNESAYTRMVNLILQYNPNVNTVNILGVGALHVLVARNQFEIINNMIQNHSADINIQMLPNYKKLQSIPYHPEMSNLIDFKEEFEGSTVLHWATIKQSIENVEKLIDFGANIDYQNTAGKTPIHLAVIYNRIEVFELLIQKGASIKLKDNQSKICMEYCKMGNEYKYYDALTENQQQFFNQYLEEKSIYTSSIENMSLKCFDSFYIGDQFENEF